MQSYLLFHSRSSLDCAAAATQLQLASDLRQAGNEVSIFFVGNGVFTLRDQEQQHILEALATKGVSVLAESFSLHERGIQVLPAFISTKGMDYAATELAAGKKILWF